MHSISKKLFSKDDSRNTQVSIFCKENNFFGSHAVSTREKSPIKYQLDVDPRWDDDAFPTRRCLEESRFNDANLSENKCACS